MRPAEAGTVANGVALNGLHLNGVALNGLGINGVSLNGLHVNGVVLNGTSFNNAANAADAAGTGALRVKAVRLPDGRRLVTQPR